MTPGGGAEAGAGAAAGSAMSLRERSPSGAVEAGENAAAEASPAEASPAEPDGPGRCLSLLPWDRFSAWLHCVCVVGFDLELGQAVEVREAAGARRPPPGFGGGAPRWSSVGSVPCGGGRLCGRAPPESGTSSGAGVAQRRGKLGGAGREVWLCKIPEGRLRGGSERAPAGSGRACGGSGRESWVGARLSRSVGRVSRFWGNSFRSAGCRISEPL